MAYFCYYLYVCCDNSYKLIFKITVTLSILANMNKTHCLFDSKAYPVYKIITIKLKCSATLNQTGEIMKKHKLLLLVIRGRLSLLV